MSMRKLERRTAAFDDPFDEPVRMPETAPPAGGAPELDPTKFQIADTLRTRALSPLDLQAKLTDPFMLDEERAEYNRLLSTQAAPPPVSQAVSLEMQAEPHFAAARSGYTLSQAAVDMHHIEAPLPARGPFGETLGVEGSLLPEIKPQGLMCSVGYIGVPHGLLAPRDYGGGSFATQSRSTEQQRNPFEGMLVSNEEIQRHFQPQPLNSGIPSLWQKHGPSPVEEIITRLFQMLKALFGFGPQGGYRGGRPEMGRG